MIILKNLLAYLVTHHCKGVLAGLKIKWREVSVRHIRPLESPARTAQYEGLKGLFQFVQ